MAGQRRLREIVTVADNALAAAEADDRRLQHLGDREHLGAGIDRTTADKDQRVFRSGEECRGLIDLIGIGLGDRRRQRGIGQRHRGCERQHIGRDLDPDGARAAIAQLPEGLVDEFPGLARMLDARGPFGQPLQDTELVRDLVQQAKATPDHVGGDLAADA